VIKTIRQSVDDIDAALTTIKQEVDETEEDISHVQKQNDEMKLQLNLIQQQLITLSKAVADLTILTSQIAAELVPAQVAPGVGVQLVFTLGKAVPQ
jgi:hypothetical protein